MGEWISSLKDLVDVGSTIKLSLPGLAIAALLIIVLWPPQPVDLIPVVESRELQIARVKPQDSGGALGKEARALFFPKTRNPPCRVSGFYLRNLPGGLDMLTSDYARQAKLRQYALEEQRENLDLCLGEEKRLAGQEQSQNAALQRDLATLEKSRNTLAGLEAEYAKSGNALLPVVQKRRKANEHLIAELRNQIYANEQAARDRDWETGELTRWRTILADRLADPGRLRPQVGFDEYVSAISSHVLAFITLAVSVGIVVQGIVTPGTLGSFDAALFGSE